MKMQSMNSKSMEVLTTPVMMTINRLRGGGGGNDPQNPRNLKVNLNLGGSKKTTPMASNYDDFLNDVVNRVSVVSHQQQHPSTQMEVDHGTDYSISVNLVGAQKEQSTRESFNPFQFANFFIPSHCTQNSLPPEVPQSPQIPQTPYQNQPIVTFPSDSTIRDASRYESIHTYVSPSDEEVNQPAPRTSQTPHTLAAEERLQYPNQMDDPIGSSWEEAFAEGIAPICVIPSPVSIPFSGFIQQVPQMIRNAYTNFFRRPPTAQSEAATYQPEGTIAAQQNPVDPFDENDPFFQQNLEESRMYAEIQRASREREKQQLEMLRQRREERQQLEMRYVMGGYEGGTNDFLRRRLEQRAVQYPDPRRRQSRMGQRWAPGPDLDMRSPPIRRMNRPNQQCPQRVQNY